MARRDYLKQDDYKQYDVGTQLYFPPNTKRDVKTAGQKVPGRDSGHPALYYTSWMIFFLTVFLLSLVSAPLIKDPFKSFALCLILAAALKVYLAKKWRVAWL